LKDLFMPKNQLFKLPSEIGNLVNLRRVSFSGNKMTSALPKSVGEWTKVEEVYLCWNDFDSLPQSVSEWKNLVELHLAHCKGLTTLNPKVAFPLTLMRIDLRDTSVEFEDCWHEPPKGEIPKRIPPFYILTDKKPGGKKK